MSKLLNIIILTAVIIFDCSGSGLKKDNSISSDFKVVFGSGGGFTGLYNGYTIKKDGSVFKWGGRFVEENPHKIGVIKKKKIVTIMKKIREIDFFNMDLEKVGNMNRIIVVNENGKKHRINWPVNQENQNVVELYELCMNTVRKFK